MTSTRWARTEDGARIAFESLGSGRPLIFVHGLGDDRTLWRSIASELAASFECVLLDLRGHGESLGGSDFGPFGLHRDIAAVVAELRFERPLVVGHSLGGMAVTTYAAKAPVRGTINVDQPLELEWLATRVRALGPRLEQRPASKTVFEILDEIGYAGLSPALLDQLRATRAKLSNRVLYETWAPLLRSPEEIRAQVRTHVQGIVAPYLSLHGAPPADGYGAALRQLIPAARIEVWDNHGHFPHLVSERRFIERVRDFDEQAL
jgi:pimeloyl-ACP methyl ester carboxylesterase